MTSSVFQPGIFIHAAVSRAFEIAVLAHRDRHAAVLGQRIAAGLRIDEAGDLRGHRPGIARVAFLDLRLGGGRPVGGALAMHVVEQARVAHQCSGAARISSRPSGIRG